MNIRRKETRADVDLAVNVNKIVFDGANPIIIPETFEMKVINLSVNGIMFLSTVEFDEDEYFSAVLTLNENDMYIACKCVRKMAFDDGFGYGCSLLGVSKSEQQIIRQYIFTQQLDERVKTRDKYSSYLNKMIKYTSELY